MKSRIIILLGIFVLTFGIARPGWSQQAATQSMATKIGTCNVLKVISGIKEYQDLTKQLKADYEKIQGEIEARSKKLADMNDLLKVYKPDTQQYTDKTKEISNYKVELEAWVQEQQMEGDRKQKQITKALWDKVQAMITQVAKEKGFDLIVADQSTEVPKNIDDPKLQINVLNAILLQRTVLYGNDKLDITPQVIQELDKAYALAKP